MISTQPIAAPFRMRSGDLILILISLTSSPRTIPDPGQQSRA